MYVGGVGSRDFVDHQLITDLSFPGFKVIVAVPVPSGIAGARHFRCSCHRDSHRTSALLVLCRQDKAESSHEENQSDQTG